MEIRKLMLMVLCLVLSGYLCFEAAEGFNSPSYGKYKTIIKKQREVEESDIEPARAVNPRRKASENKRPWMTDTFLEMENLVFEPWDNVYRTMDWPKYAWPDGTRQNYLPWEFPDWSGCAISAPPYWNIVEKGNTYLAHINIIKGVIRAIQVKGPATIGKIKDLDIPVHVYDNAVNGTVVTVTLFTVSVVKSGKYFGTCSAETVIQNEECTCSGADPTVYAADDEIAPGGTQSLWVDSGGLACPPYTWSVSGTGYGLDKGTTANDLEVVTLSSAAGVCGVAYSAYATVTATDTCGSTSAISIRNTGGAWPATSEVYARCLADGNPCQSNCTAPYCTGSYGSTVCAAYDPPAGQTYIIGYRKWVFGGNQCTCVGTSSYCRDFGAGDVPVPDEWLHPSYPTPELNLGRLDCPHEWHRCIGFSYGFAIWGCP